MDREALKGLSREELIELVVRLGANLAAAVVPEMGRYRYQVAQRGASAPSR